MKGGCLHRFLLNKLCFSLVVLLIVPIIVFLPEGAPVLTIFNTTPEQLKVFSQGFLQQQEQERLGDNVSALDGLQVQLTRTTLTRVLPDGTKTNYAKGKWVADEKLPLYSGNECKQWLSKMWACQMMQRTDFTYESYQWQPHGCEMPKFSEPNFLKRMRHKTLAFVGDSLGRQQFQSMMCIAAGGKYSLDVEDVGWKYGLVKAPGHSGEGEEEADRRERRGEKMGGGIEVQKNRWIEEWNADHENLELNFRWTRRSLAVVGLFGLAAPLLVYKGIVYKFHMQDEDADRPYRKFL